MKKSKRGLHVALLGMDGIGKTTFANTLAEKARDQGIPIQTVSWRSVVEDCEDPNCYPIPQLRMLWLQSFRTYFAGATRTDGQPLRLPETFDLLTEWGTEYLNGLSIQELSPAGPLAAAWIELAGNTLLHYEIIQPLVAEGFLVLQESYGYKHVFKLLAVAEDLAPELGQSVKHGRDLALNFFGNQLVPDVGVYIAGDPALAQKWRERQSVLGTFEMLPPNSERDLVSSFIALQHLSSLAFDHFAETHSWNRVDVIEASERENFKYVLDSLATTALSDHLDFAAALK